MDQGIVVARETVEDALHGESREHDSQHSGNNAHFPFTKARNDLLSGVEHTPRNQINNRVVTVSMAMREASAAALLASSSTVVIVPGPESRGIAKGNIAMSSPIVPCSSRSGACRPGRWPNSIGQETTNNRIPPLIAKAYTVTPR